MQMEFNPRVSKFRPEKQTIPEKCLYFPVNLSFRAERPSDYYRAFFKQSKINQETKHSQLFSRVHGIELTPLSRVLLHKLTVPQLVNKFPTFMQPECSLPNSQQPATYPCAEQDYFISRSAIQFLKIRFYIILPSTPRFSK
jgi:hypothetical protein